MSEENAAEVIEESNETVEASETQEEQSSEQSSESEGEKSEEEAVASAKEELKSQIEKFQLKVDGEEIEEELDWNDKQAVVQKLQLARVAQKRMQEAAESKKREAEYQKDIQDFLEALKKDPYALLSDENLNVDLKGLAEKVMDYELQQAQKSPEQREKEELEARLQKMEAEVKRREAEAQENQRRAMEEKVASELEQEIINEIKANQLPQNEDTLAAVAKYLKAGMKFGVDLSVREVVPYVKKELYENAKKTLSSLSDEELYDMVGKDRISNIRANLIKRAKELQKDVPSAKKIKDQGGDTVKEVDPFKKNKGKKLKSKDFFKNPLQYVD